mmetsp:Transcript_20868/g.23203  ORF Transcript_20868/g.23203 Transcript_20868/m.23203 type:complete len:313 (+) Transcript_20868:340-1278(+)
MHEEGICHRDLKMENLLLDEKFNLKVSDLGFCTNIMNQYGETNLATCKGTPGYMAPEMININGFNHVMNQKSHKLFVSTSYNGIQTDVFALGVILFSLYMGRPPFKIADINDPFYRLIFTHQFEEFWTPWNQFASQNNFEIPEDFKNLFIACVTFSPLLRISINEILSNSWMKRDMPSNDEVNNYMSATKLQIDEVELRQNAYFNAAQSRIPETKEEVKEEVEGDNLNDSSLSEGSQFKDDEENIMKDLQDIESEFNDNNLGGSNSFNLGDDDFDLDGLSDAEDVDVDDMLEESTPDEKDLPLQEEKSLDTD